MAAAREPGEDVPQPRGGITMGVRGPVAASALVAVVVVAFQLPIFDRWISGMDEGHLLLFADLIAKGGDLYRDATLYPLPGAFYLLAQFFKVFEPSILLTRWIVLCQFTVFAVLLTLWIRRIAPPTAVLSLLALLLLYRLLAFPHWQMYSYSTTSLLAIVAACLCLLRFFDGRQLAWLGAAGLLFGFSVYCKQDYGAAALIAMGVTLAIERLSAPEPRPGLARSLGAFVGAGAAVGAAVGIYFAAQGILPDLLQQTILNHLRGIGTFSYTTYPPLWPLFEQEPGLRTEAALQAFFPAIVTTVDLETLRHHRLFQDTAIVDVTLKLFIWAPYGFVAAAIAGLVARRSVLRDSSARGAYLAELLLVALGAAFLLLLTVNRPQDFLHLSVLYWPFLMLGNGYGAALFARHRRLAWVVCALLLLPAVAVVGYGGRAYQRLRIQHDAPVPGKRAGVRAKPAEAAALGEATAFLVGSSPPDEAVAVLPYYPMLHFLADRRGPHRSAYIVWPFPEFEDRDQQLIDAIDSAPVDRIVYNFSQFHTLPKMAESSPALFQHLVDHFEMTAVYSHDAAGLKLGALERVGAAPPGRSLLDEAWHESEVWIESEEAPPVAIGPADRDRFALRTNWPFRPVLSLRPSSGGRRTVFTIPAHIEPEQVLHSAVSVHPSYWFDHPTHAAHFEVSIQADGARHRLYRRSLDPHVVLADRGWFEIELPLDAWAGRDVELIFSTEADLERGEVLRMAGFEAPRLVSPGQ